MNAHHDGQEKVQLVDLRMGGYASLSSAAGVR